MFLQQALQNAKKFLEEKKVPAARRVVEELFAQILGLSRTELYFHFDRILTGKEKRESELYLKRYAEGEPLEYILGRLSFYGCSLKVDQRVLIPRQETEILVEKVIEKIAPSVRPGKVLVDMCSGSGCLGIALKKRFPELDVHLVDISPLALEVASTNVSLNQVAVKVHLSDFFENYSGPKIDYLVCNPPYISEGDFQALAPSVRDYEPTIALVGGALGLDCYEKVRLQAQSQLKPNAKLFFEIGYDLANPLMEMFQESCWGHCRIEKDLAGLDRFFFLEYHSEIQYPVGPA